MKTVNNLPALKILVRDAEFSASLSRAVSLMLETRPGNDNDDDDWGEWSVFRVGNSVLSQSNLLYTVVGFTVGNTVICQPVGDGHDPAVMFVEFKSIGLRNVKLGKMEV